MDGLRRMPPERRAAALSRIRERLKSMPAEERKKLEEQLEAFQQDSSGQEGAGEQGHSE